METRNEIVPLTDDQVTRLKQNITGGSRDCKGCPLEGHCLGLWCPDAIQELLDFDEEYKTEAKSGLDVKVDAVQKLPTKSELMAELEDLCEKEGEAQMTEKLKTKSEVKAELQAVCDAVNSVPGLNALIRDNNVKGFWLKVRHGSDCVSSGHLRYRPDVVAPRMYEMVIGRSDSGATRAGHSAGEIINGKLAIVYEIRSLNNPTDLYRNWFCPATQTGSDGWRDWVPDMFVKLRKITNG